MNRRVLGLILALVLVVTCAGVAFADGASAADGTANTAAAPTIRPLPRLPIMASLTDEQKAAVKAKLDTLKSIEDQIRTLNMTNARNRVKAAVAEIQKAEAANDTTTVEKLWGEIGRLMRPAMRAGMGPGMRIRRGLGRMMKQHGMNVNPGVDSTTTPDGTQVTRIPKGPRFEAFAAVRDAKDYDSLMTALDKAIADAQVRLADAQAGKLPAPPAQPTADGTSQQ